MTVYLDAASARRWFTAALGAIAAARPSLDALNLFPVPDADTGSNVVRTLAAGARAAEQLPHDATLGQLAAALAEGSLWGAHGNSGVIVAQSLQAIAQSFDGLERANGDDLIRAFDSMAAAAYAALAEPADGTIVSVARAIAAATITLPKGTDVAGVLGAALEAAYEATEATTFQLPVLYGTGKVDAGAVSLVIILEALAQELGLPTMAHPTWLPDPTSAPAAEPIPGYEVMYILQADTSEANLLRSRLAVVGEAVVVMRGAGDLWHVHVHLAHPAQALTAGNMSQVVVRRLEASHRGIVAATTAPGLLEPLAEAGAVVVLNAGDRTISRAILDTGAAAVTVLPSSAESAAAAAEARQHDTVVAEGVHVSIAGTASNLAVYDAVLAGDASSVAVAAHEFTATGPLSEGKLRELAGRVVASHPEVVTILTGAAAHCSQMARHLADYVRTLGPETEVYVVHGGQQSSSLEVLAQ